MKTLKYLSISLMSGFLFTSCVSMKKYEASIASNDELIHKTKVQEAEIKNLNFEITQLETEQLMLEEQHQADLDEKNVEIWNLENRLETMEDMLQDQKMALNLLHQEVCSALKCFTPSELSIDVRDGKLYVSLSDKLLFDSGSADVNDRGEEALEMLADVLASSDLEIMIEGHTDSIPIRTVRYEDNWDLSVDRATNVARIMIENGVNNDRVIASGRGSTQPIASNETENGRQLNRRTEIVLAPKLDKLWKLAEEEPVTDVSRY